MFIILLLLIKVRFFYTFEMNSITINTYQVHFDCPNKYSKIKFENKEDEIFLESKIFEIENFSYSFFGRYTCIEQYKKDDSFIILNKTLNVLEWVKTYYDADKTTIVCMFDSKNFKYNISIGKTVILQCNCGSLNGDVMIKWFNGDFEIKNIFKKSGFDEDDAYSSLELKFINVTDIGFYSCVVSYKQSSLTIIYEVILKGLIDQKKTDSTKHNNLHGSIKKLNKNVIKNQTKTICCKNGYVTSNISQITKVHEKNQTCSSNDLIWKKSLITTIIFLFCVIVLGIILFYKLYNRQQVFFLKLKTFKRVKRNNLIIRNLPEDNCNEDYKKLETIYLSREIDRKNLKTEEVIGAGNFGIVKKGKLKTRTDYGMIETVAVKTLKNNNSNLEFNKLLEELNILIYLGLNKNLVELIGFCTANIKKEPLLLVYAFAENGNLKNFLLKNKNTAVLTNTLLINFAYQISNGMEFVSSKCCIHRDLAARNILVFENNILKICDFGLAKITRDNFFKLVSMEQTPYKWLAFESLNSQVYTTKSDVWMFGVLLWEMFSFGDSPYNDIIDISYNKLILYLEKNNRLGQPSICPDNIYEFMLECWSKNQNIRPSFQTCKMFFKSDL